MENLEIRFLEEDVETTDLREVVNKASLNISKVIDIEALKAWSRKEDLEIMFFGSRVRLQEKKDSDLDIMVFGREEANINEAEKDTIYKTIKSFVLDERIDLDVFLNLSTADDLYGVYLGKDYSDEHYCDYGYYYRDIVSCIHITKDECYYEILDSLEDIYSDGVFFELVY